MPAVFVLRVPSKKSKPEEFFNFITSKINFTKLSSAMELE